MLTHDPTGDRGDEAPGIPLRRHPCGHAGQGTVCPCEVRRAIEVLRLSGVHVSDRNGDLAERVLAVISHSRQDLDAKTAGARARLPAHVVGPVLWRLWRAGQIERPRRGWYRRKP